MNGKILIVVIVYILINSVCVCKASTVFDDDYDMSGLQRIVDESGVDFDMEEYAGKLIAGKGIMDFENGQDYLDYLIRFISSEIKQNARIYSSIFAIAIASGIIAGFGSIFNNTYVSMAGANISYIMLLVILLAGFVKVVDIAGDIVAVVFEFMRLMMPTYFLAVAASGNVNSAIGFYEISLVVAAAVEWMFLNIYIPFTKIHVLLAIADSMSSEKRLSKIAGIVRGFQKWMLRTTIAAVSGINMIEGIILPSVDNTTVSAVSRFAQAIPGIGNTANTVTSVALGSGSLIKNTIGVTGLVAVIAIAVIPALRIAASSLAYNVISAIVQPIADKGVTECISIVSEDIKMLYKMVITLAFVVIVTLAIVCASTNKIV